MTFPFKMKGTLQAASMEGGSVQDLQMQLEQQQVLVIQLKEMIREREKQLQEREKEFQVIFGFLKGIEKAYTIIKPCTCLFLSLRADTHHTI